jgi:hypothetical protein
METDDASPASAQPDGICRGERATLRPAAVKRLLLAERQFPLATSVESADCCAVLFEYRPTTNEGHQQQQQQL